MSNIISINYDNNMLVSSKNGKYIFKYDINTSEILEIFKEDASFVKEDELPFSFPINMNDENKRLFISLKYG